MMPSSSSAYQSFLLNLSFTLLAFPILVLAVQVYVWLRFAVWPDGSPIAVYYAIFEGLDHRLFVGEPWDYATHEIILTYFKEWAGIGKIAYFLLSQHIAFWCWAVAFIIGRAIED
jgi:hypothetical protein